MKTIAEVMKKAKRGDSLTDGKRIWYIGVRNNPDKVATPVDKFGTIYPQGGFELWGTGTMEKVAVIPGLKVVPYKGKTK